MVKIIVGFLLIVIGVLYGVIFTGFIFSEGIFHILMLLVFSYPVFMLGQWLRIGTRRFKERLLKYSLIFIQVAVVIPTIFILFDYYIKMKSNTYTRKGFLWFETNSSSMLGYLTIFLLITLVLLLLMRAVHGWAYGGKKASILLLIVMAVSVLFFTITWNDYKAIDETEGIIISEWSGKEKNIEWSSIKEVKLVPFVKKQVANKYGEKKEFAWKYQFIGKEGEKVDFETTHLSKFNYQKSLQVKEKTAEEKIPLLIVEMDSETEKWYELELELDHIKREPFDELFNE